MIPETVKHNGVSYTLAPEIDRRGSFSGGRDRPIDNAAYDQKRWTQVVNPSAGSGDGYISRKGIRDD